MAPFQEKDRGGTDIAALSGGVVAAAFSIFSPPGPFAPSNAALGFTLLAIIAGYVWPHRRTPVQAIAVSATVGLALIPIVGFFYEIYLSDQPLDLLAGQYHWNCDIDPCQEGKPESRVSQGDLAIIWLYGFFFTFVADVFFQYVIKEQPAPIVRNQ